MFTDTRSRTQKYMVRLVRLHRKGRKGDEISTVARGEKIILPEYRRDLVLRDKVVQLPFKVGGKGGESFGGLHTYDVEVKGCCVSLCYHSSSLARLNLLTHNTCTPIYYTPFNSQWNWASVNKNTDVRG